MAPVAVLIGFMGSGKTVAGAAAAASLGWRFVDLDEEITARIGRSIEDLFMRDGEAAFRAEEARTAAEILAEPSVREEGLVLSLGGGAIGQEAIRRLVARQSVKVWLRVQPEVAWERVAGSGRPLARDRDSFIQLALAREGLYRNAADAALDTSRMTETQVASRLALLVQGALRAPRRDRAAHADRARGAARVADEQVADETEGEDALSGLPWRVEVKGKIADSLILGGPGAWQACSTAWRQLDEDGRRVRVATDVNLAAAWPVVVRQIGEGPREASAFVVPAGEAAKSIAWAKQGWHWLANDGARRDDVVLAFGGGVVGDLAGFVAATYQRGVELWQLPTSLLAQVDSSVGGKVAINLEQGKNLVGAFHQPSRVFIDPIMLLTLPPDEVVNGLGEVVKYGLLAGEDMLGELERLADRVMELEPRAVDAVVRRCVEYKAAIVQRDERESGERAVLNLGHTTAHAIERTLGYGRIGHGVAVGLGLLVALHLSEEIAGCRAELRPRVAELMKRWGLPAKMELPTATELIAATKWDKKSRADGVGFVLIEDAGRPLTGMPVPEQLLRTCLEEIRL